MGCNTAVFETLWLNIQYSCRRRLDLTEENATTYDQCGREQMLTTSTLLSTQGRLSYHHSFPLIFSKNHVPWLLETPE